MICLYCRLATPPSLEVWDLASGHLFQNDCLGVDEGEVAPKSPHSALHNANEFEQALEPGLLSPPMEFRAYFREIEQAEAAKTSLLLILKDFNPFFLVEESPEQDYSNQWKNFFQPQHVRPNWLIRAPWHEAAHTNEIEIIIEPGMAFGTGSHETTQTCLEQLAYRISSYENPAHLSVLDFGCGSGVLAIALKRLGVHFVEAVDIDPNALEATRKNAALNGVSIDAHQNLESIAEGFLFDGIIANILRDTLINFAPLLKKHLKKNGFLILSGLLWEQVEEVVQVYHRLGFQLMNQKEVGEWACLEFILKAS